MGQLVIHGSLKLNTTIPSGTGDNVLTADATTGDLGQIGSIDTSTYVSSTLPSGNILVGSAGNVATSVNPSGDIDVTNAGVFSINPLVIVDGDINASAGITLSKLAATTASRALVSDGSGFIVPATTTATEIGYVNGVTSAIQTQLDSKVAAATLTTNGDILFRNGAGTVTRLPVGTNGYVLGVTAGIPTWEAKVPLANGGTTGQYLAKASNADGDVAWTTLTAAKITDITASAAELNITDGLTATTTELNYSSGVTSNIQTQLGTKQATITGAASTVTGANLTVSRAVISNGSGKLDVSATTSTELGYVSGVNAPIQGQIDAKLNANLNQNAMWVGNVSNVATPLAAGTEGQVLTVSGGAPSWVTPGSGGSVTSVQVSGGTTGLSFSGGPVTTTGTMTMTGTLAVANGGTGLTSLGTAYQMLRVNTGATALEYFTPTYLADPMTTRGDIIYRNASNVTARLPIGTATYVLTSDGTDASWAAPSAGNLTGAITSSGLSTSLGSFTSNALSSAISDPVRTVTGTDAIVQADNGRVIYFNSGTPFNFTIDALTINTEATFINIGAGDVTFVNGSGVTYSGATTLLGGADESAAIVYRSSTAPIILSASGGGSGTVTSVGFTGGLISVATATTTPALTVAGTSGGIPYFSSSSTWASSAALAANAIVIGGGAGVAPSTTTTGTGVLTALGINTGSAGAVVLFNGAGGTPSSLTGTNITGTATGLTSGITNALKSATTTVDVSAATAPTNGQVLTATSGTTATWQTPSSGFSDPMTTRGDIIIRNASNTTARLGIGTATYVLTSDGTDVSWAAPTGGGGTWGSITGTLSSQTDLQTALDGKWSLASGGTLTGANTFTGTTTNIFKGVFNGLSSILTDGAGLWLANTTAAVNGGQEHSPSIVLEGQGWKTNATAASQSVKWAIDVTPVQGAAIPTSILKFKSNINGAGYSEVTTITNAGVINTPGVRANTMYAISGANNLTFQAGSSSNIIEAQLFNPTSGGAWVFGVGQNSTRASGDVGSVNLTHSFAPASGTATYYGFGIQNSINMTGGASGQVTLFNNRPTLTAAVNVTGFDYNPTVTSVSGTHLAYRSTAGNWQMQGSGTILTLGGGATASELRFLEPSGSGSHFTAFKAVAQSADITYSLPPTVGAANSVLTDVAGNGVLTWATGGVIQTVKVTLSSANILSLNSSPITLIAAQGSGTVIEVISCLLYLDYNSVAYNTHVDLDFYTGTAAMSSTNILSSTSDNYTAIDLSLSTVNNVQNQPLTVTCDSGNPLSGDSPVNVYITYRVITL